jgi:hypothetical protein
VENACLAFAWNAGQRVSYWREEPLEVDGVREGSWGAWAIEVKTGVLGAREIRGLLEFVRRFPKFQPLLVCDTEQLPAAARLGVSATSWKAISPHRAPKRAGTVNASHGRVKCGRA